MESSQGSGFDIPVPVRMTQSPGINSDTAGRQSPAPSNRTSLFSRLLKPGHQGPLFPEYYSVPVRWFRRGAVLPFDVYGKDSQGEVARITSPVRGHDADPESLEDEEGVSVICLKSDSGAALLCYLDDNLEEILADPELSNQEKAELFYYLAYWRLRAA